MYAHRGVLFLLSCATLAEGLSLNLESALAAQRELGHEFGHESDDVKGLPRSQPKIGHDLRHNDHRADSILYSQPAGHTQALRLLQGHTKSQQVPMTVESQSFVSRMGNSFMNFVLGCILIIFSFPMLWFNESRNAKMESLIGRGEMQCRTVSGKEAKSENRDWLVHLQGEGMRSAGPVGDPQFKVTLGENCVRLRTVVEVYQHIQHEEKREREKLGGGTETITKYTYSQEWSSVWHDSRSFKDLSKVNSKPPNLQLGEVTKNCTRVECGDAFLLSDELISQCTDFACASERLGERVQADGATFIRRGRSYCCPVDGDQERNSPRVGDGRAKFEFVPDGPISLLALQVESSGEARDSFLPYRLISQKWCGLMSDEEEKAALRKRAEISPADLAKEAQMGSGCLWCLCCACNLVQLCCSGMLRPEIYRLYPGSLSKSECFERLQSETKLLLWVLRLLGWVMLFIGLYSLFSPILTFIKVVPFLGPTLSTLGGWLIWILCLVFTLAIASIVVCLAYLFYRPLWALFYGLGAAAIVAIPLVILHLAR